MSIAAITLNLVPIGILVLPVNKAESAKARANRNLEFKSTTDNDIINEMETCILDDEAHESSLNEFNTKSNNSDVKKSSIASKMKGLCKAVGLQNLKSGLFITYVMLGCSTMNTLFCTGVYMSGLARERCNLTNADIAIIIAIAAGMDLIAKVAIGFVLDIRAVRRRRPLFFVALKISNGIVGLFIASVVEDFLGLCLTWVIFLILNNTCFAQVTVLLADIVCPEEFTVALGLARLFQGAWVYIGIRFAGKLQVICENNPYYSSLK